jgi:hypothetical protein
LHASFSFDWRDKYHPIRSGRQRNWKLQFNYLLMRSFVSKTQNVVPRFTRSGCAWASRGYLIIWCV